MLTTSALGTSREIPCGESAGIAAHVIVPENATAFVAFVDGASAHGFEPEADPVLIDRLYKSGLGSVIFEAGPPSGIGSFFGEARGDLRSSVDLGARQLALATRWLAEEPPTAGLAIGFFASDAAAAMALIAAATIGSRVGAVVSCSGRPDLAGAALRWVPSPTLLIVPETDRRTLACNELAFDVLGCEKEIDIVPAADQSWEGEVPGERTQRLAGEWFAEHLSPHQTMSP